MSVAIKPTDKILIIAPHPDDEVIACGGFIAKYHNQIDILCVNSSGIQYPGETLPAEEVAQIRCDEFYSTMKLAGVNKCYIEKLWGKPVMIEEMQGHYNDYLSRFDMKDYDFILVPHKEDAHPEHRFVGNILLKHFLETQGYKENLKILRYELWSPLKEPNYYEDITDFADKKRELILNYKIRDGKNYAERILALNKYRTLKPFFARPESYVEAYFVDNLNVYLQKPDIINEQTDKEYKNEKFDIYLEEQRAQEKINKLADEYANKKIVLYGAGEFARCVFKTCDLSKLNIIAISDKRFEEERPHEFYNLKCIKPEELKVLDFDIILISNYQYANLYNILTKELLINTENENKKVLPLIKKDLSSIIKCNNYEEKICLRPFKVAQILNNGDCVTCCPAYMPNFSIGNILHDDFENVWNSETAQNLRKSLMNNDYSMCDLKTCIQLDLINKDELSKYFENGINKIKMPEEIHMGWDFDCNVACITCRNNIIKNDEETLKRLHSIEDKILNTCKSAKLFYTSGNGDPFGSGYARDLIKKVVDVNPDIKFFIHTNGVLCSEKLCEELNIKDKITNVIFSIHAAKKETYDKIVRYGNFDKVMQNLEWISKLKEQGQIDKIYMAFVVHKLNYKDMPDFVRLAEKFNALASFRYYRQWSKNTEYTYEDMAVFEENHPEHKQFVEMLQDDIFNSSHCYLDPNLKAIKEKGI